MKEYVRIIQRKPKTRWVPDEHEGVYSEMEMNFWFKDLQTFIEKYFESEHEYVGLAYPTSKQTTKGEDA